MEDYDVNKHQESLEKLVLKSVVPDSWIVGESLVTYTGFVRKISLRER